ncbi:MAG: hypothetical protein ACJ74U_20090 [Jatrophihabitantaceae bacterium]
MITQPAGVPDDGTPDDCITSRPANAVALALAEMAEQSTATLTAGVSVGDRVTLPTDD